MPGQVGSLYGGFVVMFDSALGYFALAHPFLPSKHNKFLTTLFVLFHTHFLPAPESKFGGKIT